MDRGRKIDAVARLGVSLFGCLERGGQGRDAADGRLQRCADGAGDGYVAAQVLAVIDAGDEERWRAWGQFVQRVDHYQRRGGIGLVGGDRLPVYLHREGGDAAFGPRHAAAGPRPLPVGGDDEDLSQGQGGLCRGEQAGRGDAIVVGDQD